MELIINCVRSDVKVCTSLNFRENSTLEQIEYNTAAEKDYNLIGGFKWVIVQPFCDDYRFDMSFDYLCCNWFKTTKQQ